MLSLLLVCLMVAEVKGRTSKVSYCLRKYSNHFAILLSAQGYEMLCDISSLKQLGKSLISKLNPYGLERWCLKALDSHSWAFKLKQMWPRDLIMYNENQSFLCFYKATCWFIATWGTVPLVQFSQWQWENVMGEQLIYWKTMISYEIIGLLQAQNKFGSYSEPISV